VAEKQKKPGGGFALPGLVDPVSLVSVFATGQYKRLSLVGLIRRHASPSGITDRLTA
jgi:hypothetical protein